MLRLSQLKICLFLFSAKRATKKKSSITHEALQSWLINTEVYHLLVKNNKGSVGGLKETGIINFPPLKRGTYSREGDYLREGA